MSGCFFLKHGVHNWMQQRAFPNNFNFLSRGQNWLTFRSYPLFSSTILTCRDRHICVTQAFTCAHSSRRKYFWPYLVSSLRWHLTFWLRNLISSPLSTPELHLSCKFNDVSTSGFSDIVFTNFYYDHTHTHARTHRRTDGRTGDNRIPSTANRRQKYNNRKKCKLEETKR